MKRTRKTTRVLKCRCTNPKCNHFMDFATDFLHGAAPKAGDLTICSECSELMWFNPDFTLRALTEAERVKVLDNEDVLKIIEALTLKRKLYGPSKL